MARAGRQALGQPSPPRQPHRCRAVKQCFALMPSSAYLIPNKSAHRPRNPDSGALCCLSGGAHPADPRRAAGPTGERAHPSARCGGYGDTSSCPSPPRSHTGPRSVTLLRSEDFLTGEGTPERVTAKHLHSPGGSNGASSVSVAMRPQFPRGITAAAFTQAEPHSYRRAKI